MSKTTPIERKPGRPRKAPKPALGDVGQLSGYEHPFNSSLDAVLDTPPEPPSEPQPVDLKSLSDVDLVKATLRAVLCDTTAPAAAKAQAARTLAEITGQLGRHAPPPADAGKPIPRLTREEMERELAACAENRSAPDT